MEMMSALQSIEQAEWSSKDDFMYIVDIETSTLMASIYADDAFNEYDEAQIQSAVLDIIMEYIDVDYYKD